MSMILDALQRADRERQKHDQPVPSLETPTARPPEQAPRSKVQWLWAGVALAVCVVAVVLFVLLRSPVETPAPNTSVQRDASPALSTPNDAIPQASAPTTAPVANTKAPKKPTAIAELYQSPREESDSVTALYREAATETPPAEVSAPEPGATIEGAEGHTERLAERPEPAAVRLSETQTTVQRQVEPEASPRGSKEASPGGNKEASPSAEPAPEPKPDIASVRDLPWNLQQTMPSLNYQRHDYRGDNTSRVMINGEERRAGQRVAEDLTLESIEQDGVIMRYRGHRFKLRALNSWVNM